MDRSSWLVVLLAVAEGGLDSDRLQKALFLLSQQGVIPETERYRFEPYRDGPAAFEVFADLDRLLDQGIVRLRSFPGSRWREFEITAQGRFEARVLQAAVSEKQLARVHTVRALVTETPYRGLVERVVSEYPQYRAAPRTAGV